MNRSTQLALAERPDRDALADLALGAAGEVDLLHQGKQFDRNPIGKFRSVLEASTEKWVPDGSGKSRLTDAMTLNLYKQAIAISGSGTSQSITLDQMMSHIRELIDTSRTLEADSQPDRGKLQTLQRFCLALHSLLIGETLHRVSHKGIPESRW